MTTKSFAGVLASTLTLASAASALADGVDPIRVDTTAPSVAGLHLDSARELTFTVSEYALVRVVVSRHGHRLGAIERAFMPGPGRIPVGRLHGQALAPGTYTATLHANDAARNYSPGQTLRFRVG